MHNTLDLNVSLLTCKDSLTSIPYLLRTSQWILPKLPPSFFVQASYHLLYILRCLLCYIWLLLHYLSNKHRFLCPKLSPLRGILSVFFKITLLLLFETMPIMLNIGKFPVYHHIPRGILCSFQVKERVSISGLCSLGTK